jgi:predicted flavoprotein YhiN
MTLALTLPAMSASNSRQRVAWSREFIGRFAGQPVKNVAVSVAGGAPVRGELLIAEDGIEGGAVYAMARHLRAPGTSLQIDLKPDLSAQQVAERLSRPRGKDSRSTYLRKTLNLSPAAIALMRETGSENPKQCAAARAGAGGHAARHIDGGRRGAP